MFKINVTIVKLFIDDRNSFANDERFTLGLNSRLTMDESDEAEFKVLIQQQNENNDTRRVR